LNEIVSKFVKFTIKLLNKNRTIFATIITAVSKGNLV